MSGILFACGAGAPRGPSRIIEFGGSEPARVIPITGGDGPWREHLFPALDGYESGQAAALPAEGYPPSDELAALVDRWPVREQGPVRGACVAFAVTAAMELNRLRNGEAQSLEILSPEFVYSMMRVRFPPAAKDKPDGYATSGATIFSQAARCIGEVGICLEDKLNYDPDATPASHYAWPVPADAIADAKERIVPKSRYSVALFKPGAPRPDDLDAVVIARLMQGVPVCVSVPIYRRRISDWGDRDAILDGYVLDPIEDGPEDGDIEGGHAFCIIGYRRDPANPAKGRFVFRNSWGDRFASRPTKTGAYDSAPAIGYGTISQEHIRKHCWEIMYRSE